MQNWRDYIFYEDEHLIVLNGDTRVVLPLMDQDSVQLCATSPPYYGLRDYSAGDAEIGSEQTPREFIEVMLAVFEDVKKVIHPSGSAILNLGDSYAGSWGNYGGENRGKGSQREIKTGSIVKDQAERNGSFRPASASVEGFKPKDKMLIPYRTAIALCDEGGWWIRQDFPWLKRNPMPSSTTDRAGTATETMFHLARRAKYFWDETAVRVGMAQSSVERLSQKTLPDQIGSNRANGGAKTNGNMKAVGSVNRDRSIPTNRNGITGSLDQTPAGSRGFRNADLWYQSIEKPHGLVGVGDEIVGIDVNPAGFSGDYCTACDRYYHNAKDKKAIRVEKDEDDKEIRFCLCGRDDKWLSHFATFSEKLVEPFIKAGTSEYGQCVTCKSPFERLTNIEYTNHGNRSTNGTRSIENRDFTAGFEQRLEKTTETIGWSKTCKCPSDEREPQTVLDIFGGAGTTAIASRRLGRKCILIELNPEYCKLIVARYKREFEDQDAVQASPAAENYAMPLFG